MNEILNQSGRQRNIVLETSSLSAALNVIRRTDCLMVVANNPVELKDPAFVCKAIPLELGYPTLETVIIQHRRSMNSQPYLWLRGVMTELMSHLFREERLFRSTALL